MAIGPKNRVFVIDGVIKGPEYVDTGFGIPYWVPDFIPARVQQFTSRGKLVGEGPIVSGRVKSIAVHPETGRLFVGRAAYEHDPEELPEGEYDYTDPGYYIDVYEDGVEVGEFGQGFYGDTQSGPGIAVSAMTGKVYVSDISGLDIETYAEIPPPDAVTDTATDVASASATLNGSVDPNGDGVTACEFDFSRNASFNDAVTVPCAALPGDGTSPVDVSAAISGLASNAKYHYRLRAENGGGESVSKRASFKTAKQ